MYTPPVSRAITLSKAREDMLSRNTTGERNRVGSQTISDHTRMQHLDPAHRAAIHCVAWILARRASTLLPALRITGDPERDANAGTYSKVRWSARLNMSEPKEATGNAKRQRTALSASDAGNMPEVDEDLKLVVLLLNFRNETADYMLQCAPARRREHKDDDLLLDWSSYFGCIRRNSYHESTRTNDAKWLGVRRAYEACESRFVAAVIICLWVFTRFIPFIEFVRNTCSDVDSSDVADATELCRIVGDRLASRWQFWKTELAPRSRDYSINTASLCSTHSRFVLRAVQPIWDFLLTPWTRSPKDLAVFLNKKVGNVGGFILQHIMLTLQLLDLIDAESEITWANVSTYLSKRNTVSLFKRFYTDFNVEAPASVEKVSTGSKHQFYHPLKLRTLPSDKVVGEFMMKAFSRYKDIVQKLPGTTFMVAFEHKGEVVETKGVCMSADDCRQLQMWLIFATNACMHQKMFDDFFAALQKIC